MNSVSRDALAEREETRSASASRLTKLPPEQRTIR